jgi:hypothetical protein
MSTNEHWKEEERKAFDFQFHGINWIAPEYKSNVMEYFFARLAAREKEVRDGIAKEIEKQMAAEGAEGEFLFGVDKGLQVAANIARKHD